MIDPDEETKVIPAPKVVKRFTIEKLQIIGNALADMDFCPGCEKKLKDKMKEAEGK